mmetsp:Transcript_9421/g.11279  ORF Transcript_9421/g.11279 Transcript_9421/m.11279 type:complete len:80 (-) Transcript_9421:119-358(-)
MTKMLLHNFIIDRHEEHGDNYSEATFFEELNVNKEESLQSNFIQVGNEMPTPIAAENNKPHPGGRPKSSSVKMSTRVRI